MIYFDNSATTNQKPKEVIRALLSGATTYSSNPGRSGHALSLKTSEIVFNTRKLLCDFLNADKAEHIIFTQNCTESLNLGILGTAQKGGHIILCTNAHNSLSRPIFELQKKGIVEVTVVKPQKQEILTASDIEPHIKPNTYLVAVNHVSNVNGDGANIRQIGELCAKNCLLFLVDCAQSAGHVKIDMQKDHIDMLALAPHKALYSPQGIGVFAFGIRANISPIIYGGTGTASLDVYQPTEYPECLESGTLSTPNIVALKAGVEFTINNFKAINEKIDNLATFMLFELQKIEGVITYTSVENVHFGVIGFNIVGIDSVVLADILSSSYGVCVRGGLHCAPLKHKHLGTTEQGVVRVSLCYYNTFTEVEQFIKIIKKLAKKAINNELKAF